MTMSEGDRQSTIERYQGRYQLHGYSPKSLGWDKGKQDIRFDVLTSQCDLSNMAVLDIGCGFGDLNHTLDRKFGPTCRYTGIDLVPDLLDEARRRWHGPRHRFVEGDFLSLDLDADFDYAIASGIFNHRFESTSNTEFIMATMTRAFELSSVGLAMDFLSDKVDYQYDHTHHTPPEEVLAFAYGLTRNVVLRNDYMPFEFTIFLHKDDSFDPAETIFNAFTARRAPLAEQGVADREVST